MTVSTRYSAATLLLASLIAPLSCSKEKGAEALKAGSTASAAPKYTKLEDVPESKRQELNAFGKQLEADLNAKNITNVRGAFNVSGLMEAVMEGVNESGKQVDGFKTGMRKGMTGNLDFIAKEWSQNDAKFKHLVLHEGQAKLRFRLASTDSGVTLIDFLVTKRKDERLGIVDFHNHALGAGMVEQMRNAALPALMELDKGFLERLMGPSPAYSLKNLEQFGVMSKKFREKDLQGAIDTYHKLSPEMKNSLIATVLHLTALQQKGDDEAYKKALKDAAKIHKSASFQFMLVDLYFLENNYDKAIECLDAFMAAVEQDAALLTLKALMQMSKGANDAAGATLKEAFALEPDSVYVHNMALDIFLGLKDYAAVAGSIRFLEKNTDSEFKGGLTDPVWADFLKSSESVPWR